MLLLSFQSYPGPSLESEDFNIPPITPPSLPDHSLVHLNEVESGYHSLCHPMNHNGLLPFHPQNMDLPEITVSNMLSQDGTLLSNSISVVRMGLSNVLGLKVSGKARDGSMQGSLSCVNGLLKPGRGFSYSNGLCRSCNFLKSFYI